MKDGEKSRTFRLTAKAYREYAKYLVEEGADEDSEKVLKFKKWAAEAEKEERDERISAEG